MLYIKDGQQFIRRGDELYLLTGQRYLDYLLEIEEKREMIRK